MNYETVRAVALRTVRHNDRSSILTAWSETRGRLALVLPAGNGKESRRHRALTMPMGLFEGVVAFRGDEELHRVRDLRGWGPGGVRPDVGGNPVRSAVALFVAEVLTVATREGGADPALWQLVVETAVGIATAEGHTLANLSPAFMVRLAGVLGIAPDLADRRPGFGFDMTEGVFRPSAPLRGEWLPPEQTAVLHTFARASEGYAHTGLARLSGRVRTEMLRGAMRYYTLHHYPMERLRSLDILSTIFAG